MDESLDFPMPDLDPLPSPAEAKAPSSRETPSREISHPAAGPLVVVEYRRRHLLRDLSPPLFILLVAAGIVSYREQIADWPGLYALIWARTERPAPIVSAAEEPEGASAAPVPAPRPLVIIAQAAPVPATEPPSGEGSAERPDSEVEATAASAPEPEAAVASIEGPVQAPEALPESEPGPEPAGPPTPRPAIAAIGFDPPGTVPDDLGPEDAAQEADPKAITFDEVWDDIRRSAEQERSERKKLEEMKADWVEEDRIRSARNRQEQVREALRTIELDRPRFRAELRRALQGREDAAARSVSQLCLKYIHASPREVEEAATRALGDRAAWLGRDDRIELLRTSRLPEPWILGYLVNAEFKNILVRGGPRSAEEAMVRAARQLLEVPLPLRAAEAPPPRADASTVDVRVLPPPTPSPNPASSLKFH